MKIGIIGAGYFGTAIAHLADINKIEKEIIIYDKDQSKVEEINEKKQNSKIDSNLKFSKKVSSKNAFDNSIKELHFLFFLTPSSALREILYQIKPFLNKKTNLVNFSKGFELESGKRLSQVFEEVLGNNIKYGAFSGPNFAAEILKNDYTASVIASKNESLKDSLVKILTSNQLRIYKSDDIIGVETCGATKNILAIASGIHESLGLGWNSKAALITRGVAEMTKLVEKIGGKKDTLLGLSGVGDIILSTTSNQSRNYQLGYHLGKGLGLEHALEKIGSTVEGEKTVKIIYKLSKGLKIEMPITELVYNILNKKINPKTGIIELMKRPQKDEL